jgi:CBS domain-containing protein
MTTVKEIMHQHTIVSQELSVKEVAGIMSDKKIGSVLVATANGPGMLTERDMLTKLVSKGKDSAKMKAKDIMTFPIKTINADADVYEACNIFTENSFRRLPVVEKGKVVGIITTRDIAKQFIPKLIKDTYHFQDFRF